MLATRLGSTLLAQQPIVELPSVVPPRSVAAALYSAHRDALVDYAQRIVRDRSRAEDVVQDAWVRVQAAERRIPLTEPLRYFYRTVRNLAVDGYRADQREVMRKGEELAAVAEFIADTTPSPEAVTVARDELRQVLEGLEELPERTRHAVKLYKFEGLKLREVAERMGISVALAHNLVLDGIEHCAQRVARET